MKAPTAQSDNVNDDWSPRVASALPKSSGLYWGGKWHAPERAGTLPSINPSSGETLREFRIGGPEEVNAAVAAAKAAGSSWSRTPPLERARRLHEAANRIRAHAQELALIDATDCGNPVTAMVRDAEHAAVLLEYFAGLIMELKGE